MRRFEIFTFYQIHIQVNEDYMGGARDAIKPYEILVGKTEGQTPLDK